VKQLIPLPKSEFLSVWPVTISPDGLTLEMHSQISEDQEDFIILDLNSMTTIKYVVHLDVSQFGAAWSPNDQNIVIFSGATHTPNTIGIRSYGGFYTLDIHTGKIAVISGAHWVQAWAVSPSMIKP
jgi:hypothetical protein